MANIITSRTRALKFHSVSMPIIRRDGEVWLRLPQIGVALGYARGHKIQQVFDRNSAEFTEHMTALVKLPTAGGEQEVRIFSLRGAHLLGMFSRTKRAAEFRHWVLDVLEASPHAVPIAAPLKAAPLVLAAPEPGIDVRKRLLDGQSNPPECGYPPEVERAIDHAAWRLAREAYELVHIYLRRRVGYHHIFGYPVKKIDVKGTIADVNRITLGQCLTNEATMYTEHATSAVRCALLAAQGASADMEKLLAELPSLHLNIPKE